MHVQPHSRTVQPSIRHQKGLMSNHSFNLYSPGHGTHTVCRLNGASSSSASRLPCLFLSLPFYRWGNQGTQRVLGFQSPQVPPKPLAVLQASRGQGVHLLLGNRFICYECVSHVKQRQSNAWKGCPEGVRALGTRAGNEYHSCGFQADANPKHAVVVRLQDYI